MWVSKQGESVRNQTVLVHKEGDRKRTAEREREREKERERDERERGRERR